jgi:ABC-type antimicrobial peptide transport system permease subunit
MKALGRGIAPTLVVQTTGGMTAQVLRDALRLVNAEGPTVRAIRATSLDDMMADSVRMRRLRSWLFGSFAVAALAIVGVGVLGLIAMTVARRTREIGVRMALGSTRSGVVRLVLSEQAISVGVGLVIGGAASWWLAKFAGAYLYRFTPYDPFIWMAAAVLVIAVVLAGALIPAVRAGRVDPVRALRAE